MLYPSFEKSLNQEQLYDYFTLNQKDRDLLIQIRKDKNFLGCAVLLKSFLFLGYPPGDKGAIPEMVVERMSIQLEVSSAAFKSYEWKSRTWDYHLALIRDHFGFRPCEVKDLKNLSDWLIEQPRKTPSSNHLFDVAIKRLRFLRIELPTEKELQRLVNSVRQKFFDRLYQTIFEKVDQKTRKLMDQCLETCGTEGSRYDWIKSKPGTLGMKTILKETEKLNFIKTFNLNYKVLFLGIPQELLLELKGRAKCEDSYQMRRHPLAVRCSLLAVLLYFRHREITDDIVRLFLELIRRIEKKADKSMEKELICDIKKVYGKRKILYKIARAARERPDGTIREVIFKEVKEEILDRIVEEFESENLEWDYDNSRTKTMKRKYSRHYRRMLKPVLEVLVFQANNPAHQPILDGLDLVRKYVDTKHIYYPKHEEVPAKLLNSPWKDVVYEETKKGCRVVKHYFELCVLQKLEKALKCKEIWVEGSYRFRNPDDDLPHDWEQSRLQYCEKLKIPSNAEDFIEPIRKEMIGSLQEANEFFSRKQDVYIYHPGKGEKGLFRIPKILKRPERPILQEIKNRVLSRWGILNLIDVLVEADRQVNFSRFFTTTGQRQVLSDDEVKERLILSLFSIGTNLGLKRIYSAAEPSCSYEDLLYFRKRYLWIDPVREAIAALVNRILEIRNPEIWGNSTACASDGKHMGAWDQNLVAEWNPHYQKRGVMAYWHVDTNATCIFSQLKTPTSSEVAAMIKGLILHDTEMRIESNFVDSHGQSEVAFPFCRFLMIHLLPRLKRIKYERLYLPEKAIEGQFSNLKGVLTRPIRWDYIYNQYDEMVRHVVAAVEKTGPIESILRRFNKNNRSHPTYKAFVEAGKALKTTHICSYLTQPSLREEIHDGLNIIENWNSANSFICYGRKSEIQTNDPEMQELTILCLHLLQNALILVNTLTVERVLYEEGFINRMESEDLHALTPLFTVNINPYGYFSLDLNKPSILEAV